MGAPVMSVAHSFVAGCAETTTVFVSGARSQEMVNAHISWVKDAPLAKANGTGRLAQARAGSAIVTRSRSIAPVLRRMHLKNTGRAELSAGRRTWASSATPS